jgi:hypothetical protein
MRKEFVECKTVEEAKDTCPWASKIVRAEGGSMAFESIADFETWERQV